MIFRFSYPKVYKLITLYMYRNKVEESVIIRSGEITMLSNFITNYIRNKDDDIAASH